ncbi:hypothetical protein B7R21_18705 [Subtercola boreus]|jgi:hypothetical protein|uniref:Uncharacterized protein n=1 Tax=Subtercola boreus TaxID=120213 RepID=A0A3E0VAY7_9MICO|nr:hypothetical protein [Subtercola boreus]RFA06693.1 hypothetical protein B7R21_18705 [Subtercola boreus]
MSTPQDATPDTAISTVADHAHHSIDRIAGVTRTAENDVRASMRDGVRAAKDVKARATAGAADGRSQARSTVATFNDRASAHPGFLFAAGAGLALGAVLVRAAIRRL